MKRFRKQEKIGELTEEKECFFVLGWTWEHLGDREFPFESETERDLLWAKHKEELLKKMYQPSEMWGEFRWPDGNKLRPAEWWKKDAPGKRKILNGATELKPGIFDFQPLRETDLECLSRLNLMTKEDLDYITTEQFKKAEEHDLSYRQYWFAHSNLGNRGSNAVFI